ncbi:Ribosomal protein S5 N-terminal [Trinorchestia longiramus]|nr:Ribosomal protein S5 N-terminal [Trinorchestia longiramus]
MFGVNVMAWKRGDLEKFEVLQNWVGCLALCAQKWTAVEAIKSDLGWSLFSKKMANGQMLSSVIRLLPSIRSLFPSVPTAYQGTSGWCEQCHRSKIHLQASSAMLSPPLLSVKFAPVVVSARQSTNFFNKNSAQKLWKGVYSVSKQGAMKGRGRGVGRRLAKDLNRGQVLGVGPINMVWPGLNAPIVKGREVVQQQMLGPDPDRQRKLQEIRDRMGSKRFARMDPLERGWSGTKLGGKKYGPPDPVGNDVFEGFESVCLEFKVVSHMTARGKRRGFSVLAVTGDGMGVVGISIGRALSAKAALLSAKNKAAQRLVQIPLYNNHTVMHDFHSQYGITEVFVRKMHEGHGLICHRALIAVCQMVGIKDIHVYIKGPKNVREVVRAFFLGLTKQKTHQQLAEEKGLHVVELRPEQHHYPKLLASPVTTPLRALEDISPNENLDFNSYVMGDRVMLKPVVEVAGTSPLLPKRGRELRGRETFLRKYKEVRNFRRASVELIGEYGDLQSFLTKKYPETAPNYYRRHGWLESDDEEE